MNNMRVDRILTHKELADKFIKVNTGVKVVEWQPILRVELEDGNWLRVFVSKEYSEINWY